VNRKQRRTAAKTGKSAPRHGIADNIVQKAIAAVQAGAMQEASQALDQVLERFPNHVEALHQKGMLLARIGDAEAGIPFLQRATAAQPNQALYWNNLAAACLTCDRLDQARDAAQRAVSLDPKYVMAWRNLGTAAGALKQHEAAAHAFEKASALAPKDADIQYQLAVALLETGRRADGRAALEKAVQQAPGNAEYLSNLGIVLLQEHRASDALPHLERAVGVEPDRFSAAFHYGIALALTHNHAPALRWLRRATSVQPRSDQAWGALADTALTAGLRDEAVDAARRAAEIAPADATHRSRLQRLSGTGSAGGIVVEGLDVIDFSSLREQPKPTSPDLSASLGKIFIG
jgi:tetratricopeptide (TPR) repeat protein